jgi:hypothetical protein
MWQWFITLFTHRRLLRELQDQVAKLQERVGAQDEGISILAHALVHATTPTPQDADSGIKTPVRLKRKTYLQMQQEYEFNHNRPLRELADKIKYGMY